MPGVQVIQSAAEFNQLRASSGSRLIVVDFMAVWCGPCHAIAPRVEQLSQQYPSVTFVKVDVDKLQDVARACGIRAMPTFQFYKNNAKVAEFSGANPARLEDLVKQHKGADVSAPSAAGGSANDTAGNGSEATMTAGGAMVDLLDVIDKSQLHCLNEARAHPVANVLTASDSYLESDTDEQLIIEVPFNQAIKLHSLKLRANDAPFAPKQIRLFVNRANLGFEEATSAPSTQDLELTATDVNGEAIIPLRFVKFQRVNHLTLFVKSNQGGEDTTRINRLVLLGSKGETTDMKEFKRVAGEAKEGE